MINYSITFDGAVSFRLPSLSVEPFTLSRPDLLVAIENIKRNHADYVTENSYLVNLDAYEDALRYLDRRNDH